MGETNISKPIGPDDQRHQNNPRQTSKDKVHEEKVWSDKPITLKLHYITIRPKMGWSPQAGPQCSRPTSDVYKNTSSDAGNT